MQRLGRSGALVTSSEIRPLARPRFVLDMDPDANGRKLDAVVLIATAWGPLHGGINSLNEGLATAIAATGRARVFCVVGEGGSSEIAEARSHGVELIVAPLEDTAGVVQLVKEKVGSPLTRATHWIGHDVHTGRHAADCAASFGHSCSVVHHMDFSSYAAIRHGAQVADEKVQRQRAILQNADHVFSVGPMLWSSAYMLGRTPPVQLVPGLPDLDASARDDGPFKVMMVGRLGREDDAVKQLRLAVRAVGSASRELPSLDWRLELVGARDGDDYLTDSAEVQELWRKETRAYFPHGILPYDANRATYFDRLIEADLVLMPSLREGFGLVGWEAIGGGVPLALTERSGLYRLLHDTGYSGNVHALVINGRNVLDDEIDEDDVVTLAKTVAAVAKDRSAMKRRALILREALRRDDRFAWSTCAGTVLDVLGISPGLTLSVATTAHSPVIDLGPSDPHTVLVGRTKELLSLSRLWDAENARPRGPIRVATVVAPGGFGKSTLLSQWARGLVSQGQADHVLLWEFRSQGMNGGAQGVALVDWLLSRFSMLPNHPTSFDERIELVVNELASSQGVLVLDGLEAVQFGPGHEKAGRISDDGIARLLAEISTRVPGLLLLGTRLAPVDAFGDAAMELIELRELRPEDGADLLTSRGIVADEDTKLNYAARLRGHPLALSLFAGFVIERAGGELRAIDRFLDALGDDPQVGRLLEAYMTQWFESTERPDEPALQLARAISLFDRPAAPEAVQALRAARIPAVSDMLVEDATLDAAMERLRSAGVLIGNASGLVDVHPLVRSWFETDLERRHPTSFLAAHRVIYDELRAAGIRRKEKTGSLDVLYQCLRHGIRAGEPQRVSDETLGPHIRAHDAVRSVAILGLVNEELEAFGHFYRRRYDELVKGVPGGDLTEFTKAWIVNSTSTLLFALGRIPEANALHAETVERISAIAAETRPTVEPKEYWGHPPDPKDVRGQQSTAIKNLAESEALLGHTERASRNVERSIDVAVDAGARSKELEARLMGVWVHLLAGDDASAYLGALRCMSVLRDAPDHRASQEALGMLATPFITRLLEKENVRELIVTSEIKNDETSLIRRVAASMNVLHAALGADDDLALSAWTTLRHWHDAPLTCDEISVTMVADHLDRLLRRSGNQFARVGYLLQSAILHDLSAQRWGRELYRLKASAERSRARDLAKEYGATQLATFDADQIGRK